MRKSMLLGMLLLGAATLMTAPSIMWGQFGSGKGGFGGFKSQDPNDRFDRYAKGRPFFLISEMKFGRDAMMLYAQQKGISNGQITRPQYLDFVAEQAKLQAAGGAPPFPPRGMNPGGAGPGMNPGQPQNTDLIYQAADADFKKRDTNGDGKLNAEEMPGHLKSNLAKWDTNGDGLIDQTEYRAFFAALVTGMGQDSSQATQANPPIIIEEEEDWDRRTTVLRAGKLPKEGMPAWFKELDTDNDGQVALYEWRKAGKSLAEFKDWDLDDDGIITPQEAMSHQATVLAKTSPTGSPGVASVAFGNNMTGRGPGGGKGGGRPRGPDGSGGGFPFMKKKSQ